MSGHGCGLTISPKQAAHHRWGHHLCHDLSNAYFNCSVMRRFQTKHIILDTLSVHELSKPTWMYVNASKAGLLTQPSIYMALTHVGSCTWPASKFAKQSFPSTVLLHPTSESDGSQYLICNHKANRFHLSDMTHRPPHGTLWSNDTAYLVLSTTNHIHGFDYNLMNVHPHHAGSWSLYSCSSSQHNLFHPSYFRKVVHAQRNTCANHVRIHLTWCNSQNVRGLIANMHLYLHSYSFNGLLSMITSCNWTWNWTCVCVCVCALRPSLHATRQHQNFSYSSCLKASEVHTFAQYNFKGGQVHSSKLQTLECGAAQNSSWC